MGGEKNNLDAVGHGQVWLGNVRLGEAMFGSAWLGKGCYAAYRIFCEGSVRCPAWCGGALRGTAGNGMVS
jgi:hypothetical protein